MVFFAPLISAATLFAGFAAAAPRPDSALGSEVAVSAPNGIILSDTAELSSNFATASSAASSSSAYYPATATSSYASVATSYSSAAYYSSASSSSAYSSSAYYTTASTAYGSATTYGSGSMNWGGSNYNDCVNQCVASLGAPPPTWTPPPTSSSSSDGTTTHTIIVAPTPGILRYMPPFVNAKPGEKIHWMWNANNHTVTKSSQLQMCNKTSDAPFASGEQNTGAMFEQVVNDTNPVFFYCGTPNHCQNGMFGTLNPGNSDGSATVDSMMSSMMSNSSSLSAMMSYLNNLNGSAAAMSWGGSVSMSNFPDWSHSYVMENVLYARAFFAMNPDTISADGKVDMSAGGNPVKFPQDLSAVMRANNAASGSPTSNGASSTASDASSTAAASSSTDVASSSSASSSSGAPQATNTNTNSAGHVAASSAVIGIAAIAASLLAL